MHIYIYIYKHYKHIYVYSITYLYVIIYIYIYICYPDFWRSQHSACFLHPHSFSIQKLSEIRLTLNP